MLGAMWFSAYLVASLGLWTVISFEALLFVLLIPLHLALSGVSQAHEYLVKLTQDLKDR